MASREQDKASASLLRRSLRDSAGSCPESEILAAYFERSLDADETRRYELHLSQCARCREQLAAMHHANEPAPAGAAQLHSSHWAWLWDWRLLAPALAALVIAAVWIAHRPSSKQVAEKSSQAPLVAMNERSEPPAAPAAAPERYSGSVSRIPNKALTAPDNGVEKAMKQRSATTESRSAGYDNEIASNQPTPVGKPAELDELEKDHKALRRDSAGATNGVAADVAASPVASSSAQPAAPPPPPAKASPESSAGGAGSIGGVISEQEVAANKSAATKAKPSGSPVPVRTLTQQAQVQTAMQSQALVLEAGDRRAVGNIISTPDPKVLWRIASAGAVELSTDGGTNWQRQQLRSFEANPQITAGYAPTAAICWLVGRHGVILLTRDAAHWVPIPPPVTTDLVGVTAQDNFSATVIAADGRKFSTPDAGDHWNPVR